MAVLRLRLKLLRHGEERFSFVNLRHRDAICTHPISQASSSL